MPTQEDSGEGRVCTQRNSELAILEVSGALNQFPGGQANLTNARSCSTWGWAGDRLGSQKRSVGVSPIFRAKWTKRREPGGARGEEAESLYPFSLHRTWELQVPAPGQTFWPG